MHFPSRSQRVDHPAERWSTIDRTPIQPPDISPAKEPEEIQAFFFFFFGIQSFYFEININNRNEIWIDRSFVELFFPNVIARFFRSPQIRSDLERQLWRCIRGRDKGCERK